MPLLVAWLIKFIYKPFVGQATNKGVGYASKITSLHALLHLCKMHLPPLREVQAGLELCDGKLNHLALQKVPARDTLADSNKKRNSDVFDTLYQSQHQ